MEFGFIFLYLYMDRSFSTRLVADYNLAKRGFVFCMPDMRAA